MDGLLPLVQRRHRRAHNALVANTRLKQEVSNVHRSIIHTALFVEHVPAASLFPMLERRHVHCPVPQDTGLPAKVLRRAQPVLVVSILSHWMKLVRPAVIYVLRVNIPTKVRPSVVLARVESSLPMLV